MMPNRCATRTKVPALVYISAVALIGALSYILLVGDVKRVQIFLS